MHNKLLIKQQLSLNVTSLVDLQDNVPAIDLLKSTNQTQVFVELFYK